MARLGLQGFRYAIISDEDPLTYGTPATVGKAVGAKVTLQLNSAELYADNVLTETDYTFSKGSISMTVSDDEDTVLAALLGRTVGTSPAEIVRKNTDVAPYVGVGRIITKIVGGVYKYKAEFLSKVKFQDTMPEDKTKGEKVEFGTVELMGEVCALSDGTWSKTATFTTVADAVSYLDDCFGVA